jgi:glucosamine--fructose-6-phosphate aminotransferase (isomerizing)
MLKDILQLKKHGPIALIDEHMPVVVIAPKQGHYDKM